MRNHEIGSDRAKPMAFLSLNNVSKWFGGNHALRDVTFTIEDDAVIALTGGNGSGKSTLLKVIAGVLKPEAGRMLWEGMRWEFANPRATRRAGIDMVFQDSSLCPDCSVLENLFLGRESTSILGMLRRRAMASTAKTVLADFGSMPEDLAVKVSELSGGQQKAVAIARALLANPRLLLLDEPTAALGVRQQELILSTVLRLRDQGTRVLYCTHSPDEVLKVCDRILVMDRGKLVEDRRLNGLGRLELLSLMSN